MSTAAAAGVCKLHAELAEIDLLAGHPFADHDVAGRR
jgi:hypothetical protein